MIRNELHKMNWACPGRVDYTCPESLSLISRILLQWFSIFRTFDLYLVQHSVFAQKPGKTQWMVALGKADTNETLQTAVPCREQLFCICELKIAISGC